MKRQIALVATAAVLAATSAIAQGRPDSRAMTCNQVQTMIGDRGAVVLTTGRHTYDRYVRNRWQCFSTAEVGVRAFITTRDTKSCQVWRCEVVDPEDRRRIITN